MAHTLPFDSDTHMDLCVCVVFMIYELCIIWINRSYLLFF